jgi:hypothetical protein
MKSEIVRITLETQAGARQKPTFMELYKELAAIFGSTPKSVATLIGNKGRCAHLMPTVRGAAVNVRGRGTAKANVARSKTQVQFTCEDLEVAIDLAIESGDTRRSNITAILSELLDKPLKLDAVRPTLKVNGRCEHLREKLPDPKRGATPGKASGRETFSCDDVEEIMRTGETSFPGIARVLSNKMGKKISGKAIARAVRTGRCKHLLLLARPGMNLESFTVLAWN